MEKPKIGETYWAINDGGNGLPNGYNNGKREESKVEVVDESFNKQASGLISGWDCVVKSNWGYRRVNSVTAQFRKISDVGQSQINNYWW